MVKEYLGVLFLLSIVSPSYAYNNRIIEMSHDIPFTEVCFKDKKTQVDIHDAGESTAGGNCLPGDLGYIIERVQRPRDSWDKAVQTCLQNNGMRLPLFFEWQLSCRYRTDWGLESFFESQGQSAGWEWTSNSVMPMVLRGNSGVAILIAGYAGCNYASWEWAGYHSGANYDAYFRCVK